MDCDRNKWLDAGEAVSYGVVDKILETDETAAQAKS